MKKLSLLKLKNAKTLQPEALKKIRGGSCRSWACQCHGANQETQRVDDQLEANDYNGYIP